MIAAMIKKTGAAVYIEDERMNGDVVRGPYRQVLCRPVKSSIATGWVDADKVEIL